MRGRKIIAIALCACVLAALTGCQLAKKDSGAESGADRLIGVLVTTEYLDLVDTDSYLRDNLNHFSGGEITLDGDASAYQGRLYASLVTKTGSDKNGNAVDHQEYRFDGIDGIYYFVAESPISDSERCHTISNSSEGISDGKIAINTGDDENTLSIAGTIYVNPNASGKIFYVNPVHQSPDGSVYATSGSGSSYEGLSGEGEVYSQKLSETSTSTENGKSKTSSAEVEISFATMLPPEQIVVLQMDENSTVLSKNTYNPGSLPGNLTLNHDVSYLITETYKHDIDGEPFITRALYDQEAGCLDTFYSREDGILVKQSTQLTWE